MVVEMYIETVILAHKHIAGSAIDTDYRLILFPITLSSKILANRLFPG